MDYGMALRADAGRLCRKGLGEVDLLSSVPVRRFSWRTDQWHPPGLGYLVSTERHHGFESFEEELLLLAADFSCSLMENYAVVAGWRDHVVGLIDTFSAGRRRLTDPLQLQEQLLRAAEDGPQPFGTLVERCSLEAVARAHAMHLLWHRRLGLQITGPLTDASTIRRSPYRRSASGNWWQ